ncbi:MAG TPA: hypothetical protein EYO26_00155, partial [Dehalococcoidia bacterium]|nr:hypothetical protein [Dehalococcoidia bacterium]
CKSRDNVTAEKITSLLPLKSNINVWGDEIYFPVESIKLKLEDNAKDPNQLLILKNIPQNT